MDIKTLKIFVQIVQSQSFTAAAEQLYMTQPTVSKAIAAFEQELATTLFKKGEAGRKREVELTYTVSKFINMRLLYWMNKKKFMKH